ncbi:YwbE family protein [uncultured Pseudodesulfovibrio sp.]|uniref:YwbE family protein n=1 Tax=uncultured Pseudodesulfovibrio sp. TaxID=2035858 RepID=UPI0029C762AA|nr:YwbE family protein [uncultured Pseudodesulfovibrio sp.]
MDGRNRKDVKPGQRVNIVLKKDQRTGKLTEGTVANLLTKSPTHPHGIKVRLADGQVGRVKEILGQED